ncbi:MAG TPA: MarR family transcriptional regulator [Nocardioides sp.]|nr:MarR family transcriptional regulator [Nocardioides sp.]
MFSVGRQVPGAEQVLLPALAALAGHVVWRANARVVAALESVLPENVDIQAYAALVALGDGVPRSQQALARSVSVSRTTVMRVAVDLSDRGLVTRVRNPEDRRSYLLTRTAEGAAAARTWRRHFDALERAIIAGLTPRQRDDLRALLLKVVEPGLAPDTPEALRNGIGFLITRLHHSMRVDFTVALEPLGIEPPHAGLLTALRATGPISQSELARVFAVSGAHMVQLVDDLEARGLVERRRLETDRRAQLLHLLPGAEDRLEQALPLAHAVVAERLAALTQAQSERLLDLLRRLITTS